MPEYQGFIFTKHALDRLGQRSITQDMVVQTLKHPERTVPLEKEGSTKFIRNLHGRQVQVVATYLQDQKKWLVVSVWVRGEDDKVPLVWQLLTLPFKGVWWLFKQSYRSLNKTRSRHT